MALDKQGKEKIAFLVGFVLILAVAALTFQRSQDSGKPQVENANEESKDKNNYPLISPAELQQKIFAKEALKIMDLRDKDEFTREHIAHSLNIPAENLSTAETGASKNELLILVGGSKTNYSTAIKILEDKGYSKTVALGGGFMAWKNSQNQTVSIGDPNSFTDQAKITYTTPDKLKEILAAGEAIYILDIRPPNIYASGHLPGAINIPLPELEQKEKELPVNMEIVIYGDSELLAFQAGIIAYDLNFFTAYVLQGGIEAWKAKGFEIVK